MIKTHSRSEMISFLKTFLKGRTKSVGKVFKINNIVTFQMVINSNSIMELEFNKYGGIKSDEPRFYIVKKKYQGDDVLVINVPIEVLKEVAEPKLLDTEAMEVAFPLTRDAEEDEEETGYCRNCGKLFTREYWDQVVRCSCGEKN